MTPFATDRINRLEQFDGEDTAALLLVIQKSFGIEFTTDDLVRAETIGELGACIWEKSKRLAPERCLSAVVFYRLRRAFIDQFDIPRDIIKPDKSLIDLLPWPGRRKQWRGIQKHSDLMLPDLRMPRWLFGSSLVIATAISVLAGQRWSIPGYVLIVVGIMTLVLVSYLLRPLCRAFPRSCDTFGDLVRLALARNYGAIAAQNGTSSETEALQALRQLIAAEISIDVNRVRPETRFPEGLNIY
jgi:hypothetical protein